MKVAVTGATGFLGSVLLKRLVDKGHDAMALVRRAPEVKVADTDYIEGLDLLGGGWSDALRGVDVVIHAAARAHVMREKSIDPLATYRKVNVEGSRIVASAAAAAGVRRLLFVSSIKVNGEITEEGKPFRATDVPQPQDAYGISKMEAEAALFELGSQTGLEIAVIRPPLVYGPGVKANFRSMMWLIRHRVPLPLGLANSRRSLVALDNLADLLIECLSHEAAAGRVFLVSDGEDLTVREMLLRLGQKLNRRVILLPIPPSLLRSTARLVGRSGITQRLLEPLQLDITSTRQFLGWSPPVTVDEAFSQTARAYLGEPQ